MTYDVKIFGGIDEVGLERWDELVAATGAPVFYTSSFLSTFEKVPLHPIEETRYIVGFQDEVAAFGIPAYLMRGVDSMRLLHDHYPWLTRSRVLLSHAWHCYDTWLPARNLNRQVVDLALRSMQTAALEDGAAAYGFVNVYGDGHLARILEEIGVAGTDVDRRFGADLSGFDSVADYLAVLSKKARSNMVRYRRIAEQAGAQVSIGSPSSGDLDGFVSLARVGAAKYGNASFYREGPFQEFVRGLNQSAQLLEIRCHGQLIGAALILVDKFRLHFWACGSDYSALPGVSPFYLAFLASFEEALNSGRPYFECGRRNENFKLRHGMAAHRVRAYLLPVEGKLNAQ